MTTTVAERLRQGAGYVDRLVGDAFDALPERAAGLEAGMARVRRQARGRMERAMDARDEARIAIKRHPFAATALAFGIGALIGVAAGRLAGACARDEGATAGTQDREPDSEC